MRTARAHGIPLSVGRGQRSPGDKWTEQDWALAQALTAYEALLCDGCGHPLHESMDIDSDGEWFAPEPMRCHACTAIQDRVKASVTETTRAPRALKFNAERRRAHPQN